MKKQRKIEKDNRDVAIYARKSRITNKGDSIGVQFKQCADYAKKELGLDEEYEFLQYEDKGLSGYFSDRPDFQRMLHDVQDGKIKAIVCYKLDRVGRKTADLIRLMDFLEMYHVNLLICSNGINTASGLYKIFIQIFAVIAEFERDTLTERIVDNMMELAKDGRWLGGNTPMGFTVRRVTTGSGKGKSAYSYLESLPEEKCMVQRLYEIFRTTRSIQSTAKQMNEEGFHTPSGATFNASTTRLVLRNPIYCTADKRSYDYFIDHDGNVFGDMTEFDGTHGLSAYNKTDQEKYEGSDSTFISPKYVQTIESKPVSEWIIAVGKHEGFIPSEQWIEVQELLDAIAEKYNLLVVEDAAQAIDSFYKGRPLGSIGHMAAFSFHETKNIIAGEGGLLVINDDRFIRRAEIVWEKGTNRSEFFRGEVNKYGWVDVGSSFLPSEIISAFLYAQLENLDMIQERRKAIWSQYHEGLKFLEDNGLVHLPNIPEYATNNAHMFYLVCRSIKERTSLIEYLKANDILAVFHYLSLHLSVYYKANYSTIPNLSACDRFADCLVRLPMYYGLKEEDVQFINSLVVDFYKNK